MPSRYMLWLLILDSPTIQQVVDVTYTRYSVMGVMLIYTPPYYRGETDKPDYRYPMPAVFLQLGRGV